MPRKDVTTVSRLSCDDWLRQQANLPREAVAGFRALAARTGWWDTPEGWRTRWQMWMTTPQG
ncbi:MAG: hypothetical protein K6V97_03870 [Actinomycetia bacterium]|nr:hypothetical protein [Actinomycetes bacterium]